MHLISGLHDLGIRLVGPLCNDHVDELLNDTDIRIFQEALTNVMRHAKAERFAVRLTVDHEMLVLEVSDDGIGISLMSIHATTSLGLVGMRERAFALGGYVDIEAPAEGGTLIRAKIPLEPLETLDGPPDRA